MWAARRLGYSGTLAEELVEVGEHALIAGIYWIAGDGSRREPFVFQLVRFRDGQIAHIKDYRRKEQALRAARTTTV